MLLWIIAGLSAFIAWYVVAGRKWLKAKPSMAWLYTSTFGEWVERTFFKKSESILWARFLQFLGYGLTALNALDGIDLTPLTLLLPDQLDWIVPVLPLLISAAGHIQVKLRLETTKPIELVDLPHDVPAEVVEAQQIVEVAKDHAVAAVQEAKQAGAV